MTRSLSGVSFHDWQGALTLLAERARAERLLVILDEFPYLCKGNPALPSLIQRFWDNVGRHTKMFLILCGSSVSFMENEVLGEKSPLYGRRTGQLKLEGLPPSSSFKFSEGWPVRDRLKTYGIFGNIPAYLSLIEHQVKLQEMLTATAFSPTGFLYNEVFFILQQELREPARYNSVLRALAEGKTSIGEIATISGCKNTPTAARYLTTLMELGIVEKTAPFFLSCPRKVPQSSLPHIRPFYKVLVQVRSAKPDCDKVNEREGSGKERCDPVPGLLHGRCL